MNIKANIRIKVNNIKINNEKGWDFMARQKQSEIEKVRKQYLKKVEQLREILKDTEEGRLLDYENSKFYIMDAMNIDGYIEIPFIKELSDGDMFVLEDFIYHTSAEHKLKLYTVDKFNDGIILKNPSLEKQIIKYITDGLLKEHFTGNKFESPKEIPLYPKNCIDCKYNKLSHVHPDLGEIKVCELKKGIISDKIIGFDSECFKNNCYEWQIRKEEA